MLLRVLPLLLIIFSGNIQASEFPIEIIEYIDNTKVVAFINESDIDRKLPWLPFKGALPLTVVDALKAIQEYVASDPELMNATLTEIELKQIPRHKGYWHYMVKMKTQINNKSLPHYFIVLMNRKIIQGLREPETLK